MKSQHSLLMGLSLLILVSVVACAPSQSQPLPTPDIARAVEATMTAMAPKEQTIPTPMVPQATVPQATVPQATAMVVTVAPAAMWSDDFDAGIGSGWEVVEGEWMVVNGRLSPATDLGGMILGGQADWTDYTVDVELHSSRSAQFVGMVMVRVQDRNNYVGFVADCNRGTWWEIMQNGAKQEVPGTRNDTWMCSTPYRLRVVVQGDNYQAFVDGELQSSFTKSVFGSGRMGLLSSNKGSLAVFDNVRVSE